MGDGRDGSGTSWFDRPSLCSHGHLDDRKVQNPNPDRDFPVLFGYKTLVLLLCSVDEPQFQARRWIPMYKHSPRSGDFHPLLQLRTVLFLRQTLMEKGGVKFVWEVTRAYWELG